MTTTLTRDQLINAIMTSPYFNDAQIPYPPFSTDSAPQFHTIQQLTEYANDPFSINAERDDDRPLRDKLADALNDDISDLAHNANYDAFISTDLNIDDDARDDFIDIDAIDDALRDPELYSILADKLLARCPAI